MAAQPVVPNVLITGCSSGFGLEAVRSCATAGWRVFASMRNPDKRERLDQAVAAAGVADRVEVVQLDVTDRASIERAVKEVLSATDGALDGVVHNAGVSSGGAFEDVPEDEWRRIFDTNFFGVLALTQAVLPAMRARRRGRIVLVSSNAAFSGTPAVSLYNASKWALEGWAESVAYELEPFGIQVVLVEPGAYKTDIWGTSERFIPEGSAYRELADIFEPFVDKQVIARARDPKEVGDVIARALTAERPRFRYPVGPDAKVNWILRGVVPYRAQAYAIKRISGVHRWRPS